MAIGARLSRSPRSYHHRDLHPSSRVQPDLERMTFQRTHYPSLGIMLVLSASRFRLSVVSLLSGSNWLIAGTCQGKSPPCQKNAENVLVRQGTGRTGCRTPSECRGTRLERDRNVEERSFMPRATLSTHMQLFGRGMSIDLRPSTDLVAQFESSSQEAGLSRRP